MIPQPLGVAGAGGWPSDRSCWRRRGRRRGRSICIRQCTNGRSYFTVESVVCIVNKGAAPLAIEFKIGQEFGGGFAIDVIDQLKCLIHIIFRRAVRGNRTYSHAGLAVSNVFIAFKINVPWLFCAVESIPVEMPCIFQVGASTYLNVCRSSILFLQPSQRFKEVGHNPRNASGLAIRIHPERGIEVVVESLGVGLPVADIDNGGADPRIGDISNVIVCPINECASAGHVDAPCGHCAKDCRNHPRWCGTVPDGDLYRLAQRVAFT